MNPGQYKQKRIIVTGQWTLIQSYWGNVVKAKTLYKFKEFFMQSTQKTNHVIFFLWSMAKIKCLLLLLLVSDSRKTSFFSLHFVFSCKSLHKQPKSIRYLFFQFHDDDVITHISKIKIIKHLRISKSNLLAPQLAI